MYTLPLLAEYSAAKSFIEKFTLALNAEYGPKGISVQCQIPFYVSTKLAKMRKSFSVPTPDEYAKRAVRFVGQKEPVVSPSKTEEPKNDSEKSETVVKKTKKKKKKSYKNLMAGMMNSPPTKDANKDEKEKEALRKVTGGGAFSKIDKI